MTETLDKAGAGRTYEIVDFDNLSTRVQLMRFGLSAGQVIRCLAKTGPVIIGKNRQRLAIGRNLARKILVRAVQAA